MVLDFITKSGVFYIVGQYDIRWDSLYLKLQKVGRESCLVAAAKQELRLESEEGGRGSE